MRQYDSAADLLIRIFRIDIQIECEFDCFIKFSRCRLLEQRHRFVQPVLRIAVDESGGLFTAFCQFSHVSS